MKSMTGVKERNIDLRLFQSTSPYMLRQIMVVIITLLGYAQIYNQCVTCVFVITGINTLYIKNSSKNNKRYATHERDKLYARLTHKDMWDVGSVAPFVRDLRVTLC
jgi:hypothetical protein